MKNLSQNSQRSSRGSKRVPPEYYSRLLPLCKHVPQFLPSFSRRHIRINTHINTEWPRSQLIVKYTINTLEISLIFIDLIKVVQNEILHTECTNHDSAIAFYKSTGRFQTVHSR
jgi:hypothetical protein